MYLNRTVCDVLEAMRGCVKTCNFSYLPGLIEEAQTMVNRMEASLQDKNDIDGYHKEKKKLENDIAVLEEKKHQLKEDSK